MLFRSFRDEVREFFRTALPEKFRQKMIREQRISRDDLVQWHRILDAKGWVAPHWPVEYGGTGWDAVRFYIFKEEMQLAPAPDPLGQNINLIGPVIINVVGTNKATPFWLNSSVTTDSASPWDPQQLQISYAGTGLVRFDNQATSVAVINAPNAPVVVNSSDYYGSIIGYTVTFGNAAKLHFDRHLASTAAVTYIVGADMLTSFSWKKY